MIVTSSDQLRELAERLGAAPYIGLDTEFMRERTYRAELCLVQIATERDIACIDPLALGDLAALVPALAGGRSQKIMHAARQDLEVLLPAIGLVGPTFDTQIAAGLAGYAPQIGYGELVRRILDIELAKAHTRADWSRRPLTPEQIEYALDDVRHLQPVAHALTEQLERLGRTTWLEEDLRSLADAHALAIQPEQAWRRLRGLNGLDAGRFDLLQRLAAWREQRAVARNRPRGWILEDAVLREIVLRVPRSAAQLAQIAGMPEGVMRNCGTELLALIEASEVPNPPPPIARRERPDAAFTATVKRLATLTTDVATELKIAAELLATRRELEQLAGGNTDVGPLRGWRATVIGDRLRAAL